MHLLQRRVQRPELQPVLLHLRRLFRKGARWNQQLSLGNTVIYLTYQHESCSLRSPKLTGTASITMVFEVC